MLATSGISTRDWAVVVLGYTARLALFKAGHHGYAPAEWAAIVEERFETGIALRELAAEAAKGAPC